MSINSKMSLYMRVSTCLLILKCLHIYEGVYMSINSKMSMYKGVCMPINTKMSMYEGVCMSINSKMSMYEGKL